MARWIDRVSWVALAVVLFVMTAYATKKLVPGVWPRVGQPSAPVVVDTPTGPASSAGEVEIEPDWGAEWEAEQLHLSVVTWTLALAILAAGGLLLACLYVPLSTESGTASPAASRWVAAAVWLVVLLCPIWVWSHRLRYWEMVSHVWEPEITIRKAGFAGTWLAGAALMAAALRLPLAWRRRSRTTGAWLATAGVAGGLGAFAFLGTEFAVLRLATKTPGPLWQVLLCTMELTCYEVGPVLAGVVAAAAWRAVRLARREGGDPAPASEGPREADTAVWSLGAFVLGVMWIASSLRPLVIEDPRWRSSPLPTLVAAATVTLFGTLVACARRSRPTLAAYAMAGGALTQVILAILIWNQYWYPYNLYVVGLVLPPILLAGLATRTLWLAGRQSVPPAPLAD